LSNEYLFYVFFPVLHSLLGIFLQSATVTCGAIKSFQNALQVKRYSRLLAKKKKKKKNENVVNQVVNSTGSTGNLFRRWWLLGAIRVPPELSAGQVLGCNIAAASRTDAQAR
jgi:hypothetical protein